MPSELHFLNVKQGDCTWISHLNGKNTLVDVNNASFEKQPEKEKLAKTFVDQQVSESIKSKGVKGNFGQKSYPVNPIEYLKNFGVESIFRFIVTHPDMDHLGGIKDLFSAFHPNNVWDTNNKKKIDSFKDSPYNEEDWKFYKSIRDKENQNLTRLTLYSNSKGKYYNQNEDGSCCGNGLYILAPTQDLVNESNETENYNDCSYVILYRTSNGAKVILAGDSHDKTWEHILENWEDDVKNCDILIAPHHGRTSKRSYEFLDTLKPKITFFGIAKSNHLGYSSWTSRNLQVFSNNQGNCLIAKFLEGKTEIRCTNETFADAFCKENGYSSNYDSSTNSYFLKTL